MNMPHIGERVEPLGVEVEGIERLWFLDGSTLETNQRMRVENREVYVRSCEMAVSRKMVGDAAGDD